MDSKNNSQNNNSNSNSNPIDEVIEKMLEKDAKSCKLASARLTQIRNKENGQKEKK